MEVLELDGFGLTPAGVVAVARQARPVRLSSGARERMEESAAIVDRLAASSTPAYGVSTGFGSLANTAIPAERRTELQHAIVRSHAAGMGSAVEVEVVRAMMLLRARTLAMGYSGVRPAVVDTMLALLDGGYSPVVPEYGSLGASGDLAPLSACALVLIGEGEAIAPEGGVVGGQEALEAVDRQPIQLTAKEGLALVNGTDGMLAMLILAIHDLSELLRVADIVAAMSVEALLGTDRPFAADLQALRPHVGQAESAANLVDLLAGSAIVASHREGDDRVQDAYSLRCTPQVHGAVRDVVGYAARIADIELGSAIDNPMILPDGRVESCGNFHGAPLAHAADYLAVAVADLGALSERRTDRMMDQSRSHGLPPFLSPDAGVNSGMMIAHYTQAAMTAENRRLAAPASVDTIPTSAMQEDHVSLGWSACRKLRAALDNLTGILTVELMCAARAIDLRAPLLPAAGTAAARDCVRNVVDGPGPDRWLAPELETVKGLIRKGEILRAIAEAGIELR
ncbi:MAG: histidine ammonia-lyase [Acidimicrobiia bacterium]|nr:histidine ammonia-lyase [Acidimicrobiia bacterium]